MFTDLKSRLTPRLTTRKRKSRRSPEEAPVYRRCHSEDLWRYHAVQERELQSTGGLGLRVGGSGSTTPKGMKNGGKGVKKKGESARRSFISKSASYLHMFEEKNWQNGDFDFHSTYTEAKSRGYDEWVDTNLQEQGIEPKKTGENEEDKRSLRKRRGAIAEDELKLQIEELTDAMLYVALKEYSII